MLSKFREHRSLGKIVHDYHMKKWAFQAARTLWHASFKGSCNFFRNFKSKYRICGRKVTKFVTKTTMEDDASIMQNAMILPTPLCHILCLLLCVISLCTHAVNKGHSELTVEKKQSLMGKTV